MVTYKNMQLAHSDVAAKQQLVERKANLLCECLDILVLSELVL